MQKFYDWMNKKRHHELIIPVREDEWVIDVWRISIDYTWKGVLIIVALVLQLICAIDLLIKLIQFHDKL